LSGYRGHSVALALGGGGARGLAHIGVLEALDDLGVRPVAIAGTSIGAIVGAAYAAGYSGRELRKHAESIFSDRLRLIRRLMKARVRRRGRLRIDFAPPMLLDGEHFLDAFWPAVMPSSFEELRIPFHVVATDFRHRCETIFSSGPLRPAVAGSMAIPGLVRAAACAGSYFVDGGLVNPLPYNHLAGLADIVVAVDVSGNMGHDERKGHPSRLETIVVASQIMMNAITARMIEERPPEVLLSPAVNKYFALDLFKTSRIFAAGDACRGDLIAGLERAALRLENQRRA
jgi:NTE family protein